MTPARHPPSTILFDLDGILVRGAPGTPPYEGVREMVAALAAAGYRLGVVTGDRPAEAAFPIELFELVVSEDLQGLAIAAAEVAHVSGSRVSLAAARAAGLAIGAALWARGDGDSGAIETLEPEWAFEKPADVTRTFVRWC